MRLGSFGLALWLLATPALAQEPPPDWVETARQTARQLGSELKQALQGAMAEQGPVAAIEVCQLQAPAIARRLSNEGVIAGRTALRVRNTDNRPDAWEARTLAEFETGLADGQSPAELERFVIRRTDGRRVGHWMKAIPTDGLCLVCHGPQIAPELQQALQQRYPEDQATGFLPGTLRGAFSVEIQLPPSD